MAFDLLRALFDLKKKTPLSGDPLDTLDKMDQAWEENDRKFRQRELDKTTAQFEDIMRSAHTKDF